MTNPEQRQRYDLWALKDLSDAIDKLFIAEQRFSATETDRDHSVGRPLNDSHNDIKGEHDIAGDHFRTVLDKFNKKYPPQDAKTE